MIVLYIAVVGFLVGSAGGEEIPILYPERQVLASENVDGTTNNGGKLVVSERYLALYEAGDPAQEGAVGQVRILERESFEEVAIISMEVFQVTGTWDIQMALTEDRLAILHEGSTERSPQLALYEIEESEVERVVVRDLDFEFGDGLQVTAEGEDWVVWDSRSTALVSGNRGEELGRWPVPFGDRVGAHWFFRWVANNDWTSDDDEFWLVDLRVDGVALDLKTLPEVESGFESFWVERVEERLLMRSYYRIDEETIRMTTGFYDPEAGVVLWQDQSTGNLVTPKIAGGKLFNQTSKGDFVVRGWDDGGELGVVALPDGVEPNAFGHKIHALNGVLYFSSRDRWLLFDEDSFSSLGEVFLEGEPARSALIVPIPGSEYLAWIYNDGRSPIPQFNSYLWNPQVLIYDPASRSFVGKLEPLDSINIASSTGDGYPSPERFGIEFFKVANGRIGMKSRHLSGDGNKYQIYDPVLRVETPRTAVTASIGYREEAGFEVVLERRSPSGVREELAAIPFGQGEDRFVDVPENSEAKGERFFLREREVVKVTSDYNGLLEDVTEEGLYGGIVALAPKAEAVILRLKGTDLSPGDTLTVVNRDDGSVRFSIGPRGRSFGSYTAVGGTILAAATGTLFSADSITLFDLMSGEELLELPAARSFAVSGDVIVRWMEDELIGHRVSSDEELFRVPLEIDIPYPSARPRIVCGGGVVIMQQKVYDLETGAFRFQLSYPDSEPEDDFGAHIVADGNLIAAVSARKAKGFIYDATTGEVLRSFAIEELSEGYVNYGTRFPRLAMDAERGVIAWATNDDHTLQSVNLFEIETGERFGQIRGKESEPINFHGVIYIEVDRFGDGIALASSELWVVRGFSQEGLAEIDFDELRNRALEHRETELVPQRYLELGFQSRRGVNYRVFGGPLEELEETEQFIGGTGEWQEALLPIPAGANRWFGLVKPEWAPESSPVPF